MVEDGIDFDCARPPLGISLGVSHARGLTLLEVWTALPSTLDCTTFADTSKCSGKIRKLQQNFRNTATRLGNHHKHWCPGKIASLLPPEVKIHLPKKIHIPLQWGKAINKICETRTQTSISLWNNPVMLTNLLQCMNTYHLSEIAFFSNL